jgi:bacterioferritin (cytochrome b1)
MAAGGIAGNMANEQAPLLALNQLNSLLRGEISAAETYRIAIDKLKDHDAVPVTQVDLLRQMHAEHTEAVRFLRDRIIELGGEPSEGSGLWGMWARFTQTTANLFGDVAALKALKEGEEHGLKDYADAEGKVDSVTFDAITTRFAPAQQRHIDALDRLIDALNNTNTSA